MTTYLQRYATANSPEFQQRVGIALARTAFAVLGETVPDRHDLNRKRWDFARLVLSDPVGLAQRFALVAAAQGVPIDEPDESLENLIRQGFDQVAGVTPEDR